MRLKSPIAKESVNCKHFLSEVAERTKLNEGSRVGNPARSVIMFYIQTLSASVGMDKAVEFHQKLGRLIATAKLKDK